MVYYTVSDLIHKLQEFNFNELTVPIVNAHKKAKPLCGFHIEEGRK